MGSPLGTLKLLPILPKRLPDAIEKSEDACDPVFSYIARIMLESFTNIFSRACGTQCYGSQPSPVQMLILEQL